MDTLVLRLRSVKGRPLSMRAFTSGLAHLPLLLIVLMLSTIDSVGQQSYQAIQHPQQSATQVCRVEEPKVRIGREPAICQSLRKNRQSRQDGAGEPAIENF
jgi:hypothetical protein